MGRPGASLDSFSVTRKPNHFTFRNDVKKNTKRKQAEWRLTSSGRISAGSPDGRNQFDSFTSLILGDVGISSGEQSATYRPSVQAAAVSSRQP